MIGLKDTAKFVMAVALVVSMLGYTIAITDASDPDNPEDAYQWMRQCDKKYGHGNWVAVEKDFRPPGDVWNDKCVPRSHPDSDRCDESYWGCHPWRKFNQSRSPPQIL